MMKYRAKSHKNAVILADTQIVMRGHLAWNNNDIFVTGELPLNGKPWDIKVAIDKNSSFHCEPE